VDVLELIARSEWPLVVSGGLFLFRAPLGQLIDRISLTKFEAWGLKAEFAKGLQKVDNLTPPSVEELELTYKITHDETVKGENLSRWVQKPPHSVELPPPESPEVLVLGAWSVLEANMRAMTDSPHVSTTGALSRASIYNLANRLGLTSDEKESLATLLNLRNKVAHAHAETSLTWDDALRFMEATQRLEARMKVKWEELRKAK